MKDKIDSNYEILESLKVSLIRNITNLSQEQLRNRPSPGSWNLIELVTHLMYVENYALNQLKDHLGKKIKKSVIDRIRFFVVRRILSLNIKVKVPIKAVDPSDCDTHLEKTFSKWTQCRLDLRKIINNFSNDDFKYCYFYHPYAGRFTLNDGLIFLIDHWRHHQRQLDNLFNS